MDEVKTNTTTELNKLNCIYCNYNSYGGRLTCCGKPICYPCYCPLTNNSFQSCEFCSKRIGYIHIKQN